jgi:hypothetical protein
MKSLKLDFNGVNGTTIDLVTPLTDFACTMQNALVNLGCIAGSDSLYPNRGTALLTAGLRGILVDINAANHASNFAAIATLSFIQSTEYSDAAETLVGLVVMPSLFNGTKLVVDTQFTTSLGNTYGILTEIQ